MSIHYNYDDNVTEDFNTKTKQLARLFIYNQPTIRISHRRSFLIALIIRIITKENNLIKIKLT